MSKKMDFNINSIRKQIQNNEIKDVDLEGARNSSNIREFDERFTFKMFSDIERTKYYSILSCHTHLSKVQLPMLFINSKNDPISKYKQST